MKKLLMASAATVIAVVSGLFFVACTLPADYYRTIHYTIVASLDNNVLTARQITVYTNNTQDAMTELHFNLYVNAFRDGAAYSPVYYSDRERVFWNGDSFGGIDVFNVAVDGVSASHSIGGRDNNVLIVPVGIEPTVTVAVEFDFVLTIPEAKFRIGSNQRTLTLGQWHPTVAVWQEGAFVTNIYYSIGDPFFVQVADYDITLQFDSSLQIASSAQYSQLSSADGRRTIRSTANNIRDFAFVLSQYFETVSAQVQGVNVVYYFYNDVNPQQSLDTAVAAVDTFSRLFGILPHNHLSIVQTPFVFGGMEYSGLVMIADDLDIDLHTEVIVHEVAHQWWYSVVGNNQVAHAWLDEALAQYSTTIFYEKNPRFGLSRENRIANSVRAITVFAESNGFGLGGQPTVIERPIHEFDSNVEYNVLVYSKGEVMLDTLRKIIGDNAFFDALRYYYASNMWGIATPSHLVGSFEKYANTNLSTFFDGWLQGNTLLFGRVAVV